MQTVSFSGGGGGGGQTSASSTYAILYDTGTGGYFIRKISNDGLGAETITDLALDFVTPYTATGSIEVPTDKYDLVSKTFYDDDTQNSNGITPFIRLYVVRNEFGSAPIASQTDVELNGTPYNVVGTVREKIDVKFVVMNDQSSDFIRKYYTDQATGETFFFEDVSISDGQSGYSTVGAESINHDWEVVKLKQHDNQGAGVFVPFYNILLFRQGQQTGNLSVSESGSAYTPTGTLAPGELKKWSEFVYLDDVAATTGVRTPFMRQIEFIEGVQVASQDLTLSGTPYTPTGAIQPRVQDVEFKELKIVAKQIVNFTDAAAVALTPPANFCGAQLEVQIDQGEGFYARYETFDSIANPPTQTQGFSIGHRQTLVMGHTPAVRQDDKLEVSRFRVRGELGVTGKCHVYYYNLV